MRIAITGASGLVGASLSKALSTAGHDVVHLVRRGPSSDAGVAAEARWSTERGIHEPERLDSLDAVVHLAGENVAAGRWSAKRRRQIYDSRVVGTRTLVASLRRLAHPPTTFVCASATGYYGNRGDQPMTEESEPGSGFLASVCVDWEAAAVAAEAELGARVTRLRFGVVLATRGGALARMLPLFRLGLGGRLGSGRQYFPWISLDDAVGVARLALVDTDLNGPINAAAPEAVTNAAFTRALAAALHRPAVLPAPASALRLALGEMATEMLLAGARVEPRRLLSAGYTFEHPRLDGCLEHLLGTS